MANGNLSLSRRRGESQTPKPRSLYAHSIFRQSQSAFDAIRHRSVNGSEFFGQLGIALPVEPRRKDIIVGVRLNRLRRQEAEGFQEAG